MDILLLSRYFPPEIGTAANLFFELARGLKKDDHNITVITGFPWYNLKTIPKIYHNKFYMREDMQGIEVIRIAVPMFGGKKFKLAFGHLTSPVISFLGGCFIKKPDIIFVYSPPLFLGLSGWLISLFRKSLFVFGIQDLHPQCYIDQGILKSKLLIYILELIEKFCYKKADLITVHSKGNKEHVTKSKNISDDKVKIISNWIDTDEMIVLPRNNKFAKEHELIGKFVVGYAGTLGMSQGLMSVIETARLLRSKKDIEFFVVGDGVEKKDMNNKVKEYNLKNVRFLRMQPKSIYPYVVASFDVGLVTLNSKVNTPVVPSKILSIMAASRPVLASMPLSGDAPKLINEAGCGICIGPEDPKGLAEKIVYLSENRDVCEKYSKQGRKYVEEKFSLKKIINDIEYLFNSLINRRI